MMANPRLGQLVRIRYKASVSPMMPYHDRVGVVRIVSKGKPRNHGVEIDGKIVCIPCGNLSKVESQ